MSIIIWKYIGKVYDRDLIPPIRLCNDSYNRAKVLTYIMQEVNLSKSQSSAADKSSSSDSKSHVSNIKKYAIYLRWQMNWLGKDLIANF